VSLRDSSWLPASGQVGILKKVASDILAPFPHHSAAIMLPSTPFRAKIFEQEAGTRDAAKNHPRMDVGSG